MKGFSLIKFWPRGEIITVPVPVNCHFRHRFWRIHLLGSCESKPRMPMWKISNEVKRSCEDIWNVLRIIVTNSVLPHSSYYTMSTSATIYTSFIAVRSSNTHFLYFVCFFTCVSPVEGALRVVGRAVVQGAVEGALIENRRHVAVWRQRRPQLWIDLPCVTSVWAVKPCRYTK